MQPSTRGNEHRASSAPLRGSELLDLCLAGRYRLERIVRDGSRSVIYRATDVVLHRRVAVKLAWASTRGAVERLAAEARIHSRLHHPAIPELLDAIEQGPLRALVMEYVHGTDLDDLLHHLGRPVGLPRLRVLVNPIVAALGYLHERGIIHRDVKPANIIVYEQRLRERTKLVDFGVARDAGATPAFAPTEMVAGTLLYMSPEHFQAPEQVDERSDIYSLGVTLFQMATGTVPFHARTAKAAMRAHLHVPPPPPRALNPEIGGDLEAVILKALEKDPRARFQSGAELAGALGVVRDQPGARWRRWRRRLVRRNPRPSWLLTTTQVPDPSGS